MGGPPGVGKTALAVEVAHRAQAEGGWARFLELRTGGSRRAPRGPGGARAATLAPGPRLVTLGPGRVTVRAAWGDVMAEAHLLVAP